MLSFEVLFAYNHRISWLTRVRRKLKICFRNWTFVTRLLHIDNQHIIYKIVKLEFKTYAKSERELIGLFPEDQDVGGGKDNARYNFPFFLFLFSYKIYKKTKSQVGNVNVTIAKPPKAIPITGRHRTPGLILKIPGLRDSGHLRFFTYNRRALKTRSGNCQAGPG